MAITVYDKYKGVREDIGESGKKTGQMMGEILSKVMAGILKNKAAEIGVTPEGEAMKKMGLGGEAATPTSTNLTGVEMGPPSVSTPAATPQPSAMQRLGSWAVRGGLIPRDDTILKTKAAFLTKQADIASDLVRDLNISPEVANSMAASFMGNSLGADLGEVPEKRVTPAGTYVNEYRMMVQSGTLPSGVKSLADYVQWRERVSENYTPKLVRYVIANPTTGAISHEIWVNVKNPKEVSQAVAAGYRSITDEDLLMGANVGKKFERKYPKGKKSTTEGTKQKTLTWNPETRSWE